MENKRKLAVALTAVSAYIKTEEEALLSMPAPEALSRQAGKYLGHERPAGHDAKSQPDADEDLPPAGTSLKNMRRTGIE